MIMYITVYIIITLDGVKHLTPHIMDLGKALR